jgi:hypothetical protein
MLGSWGTLWGLECNQESWEPKNGICYSWNFYKLYDLTEILSWTQKSIRYGVEMQPQIMRAQKSAQILIFEINKDYWHVFKYQSTIFNHLGLFMFIGS